MKPSIAVIGNCQSGPLSRIVRLMLPDARVTAISLEKALRDGDAAEKGALASGHDIILAQEVTRDDLAPLKTDALRGTGRRVLVYPKVLFTGFHPDAIYVRNPRNLLGSPTGSFHSQILVGAYLAGADETSAMKLFRGEVYDALSYFDEYPKALSFLLSVGEATGFNLDPERQGWLKEGAFMHTLNHPKPRVQVSIARQALEALDLHPGAADPGDIVDTLGLAARWPVYPEIAGRLGVGGSLVFARTSKAGGGELSLEEFTSASYGIYRNSPREALAGSLDRGAEEVIAALA